MFRYRNLLTTLMLAIIACSCHSVSLAWQPPQDDVASKLTADQEVATLSSYVRGTTIVAAKFELGSITIPDALLNNFPPEWNSSIVPTVKRLLDDIRELHRSLGGSSLFMTVDIPIGQAHSPVRFFAPRRPQTDLAAIQTLVKKYSEKSVVVQGEFISFSPTHSIVDSDQIAVEKEYLSMDRPELKEAWKSIDGFPVQAVVIPPEYLRSTIRDLTPVLPASLGGGPSSLLTEGMNWGSFGLNLKPIRFQGTIRSSSPEAANEFAKQMPDRLKLWAKLAPANLHLSDAANWIANHQPKVQGNQVLLQFNGADELAKSSQLLSGAMNTLTGQIGRQAKMEKMKKIGLAFHNFVSANSTFPPSTKLKNEDGTSRLSWRVDLLPYLGYVELYNKFHLNEPWDSPHNIQLLPQIPDVYLSRTLLESIATPSTVGHTTFLAPIGEGTILGGKKPVRFSSITDGSSNTILLVEVKPERSVPWTAPQDYLFPPEQPVEGLAVDVGEQFLALICDGSVQGISTKITPKSLKYMFQMNDGQIVELP